MRPGILTLILLLVLNGLQAQIVAVTEYGDEVLLYDDGTWEYIESDLETPTVITLPEPPFMGKTLSGGSKIKCSLSMKSNAANNITDDEAWFEKNGLETNALNVPNPFRDIQGDLPGDVPTAFMENMLVRAIASERFLFLIYGGNFAEGRYLLIMDKESRAITMAYDFSTYEYSPDYVEEDADYINQRIDWTTIDGDMLYVAHSHNTYSASSKGMNAYITAIDLNTNEVAWRSKPLVSNASNFLVIDDAIVCGYGFTDEKDYLYLLNKHTGEIEQTLPLKSGPSWIIRKNDELYVRTYNTDYVFTIAH